MTLLQDILYKVSIRKIHGNSMLTVKDLQIDSRRVSPGSAFIAIRGVTADGHQFITAALRQGALAVICEVLPEYLQEGITYVEVENCAAGAVYMSNNLYGQQSEKILLVGVTGTNVNTTVVTLLYKLFTALGYTCGMLSTVQNSIGGNVLPSTHTTPDAISVNALIRQMHEAGCTYVFMEVSSHALHQHRVTGLHFAGGIFTNITHDHLDYHKTFDEYIRVKKIFFDNLQSSAFAISNLDDKRGQVMLQNTAAKKYYYSLRTLADFKGKILENMLTGLVMTINEQEVHFRMIGEFNAYNILAVFAAATCLSQEKHEVLRCLSVLSGAEGRFSYTISPKDKIIGIVDYAHTPDALLNVLTTIKKLLKGNEKVITVVGCGGDRDKAKRPLMASVACEHSDQVIFTSDNPRNEDPEQILEDMRAGLKTAFKRKSTTIADRKEAIIAAINWAGAEDIVLIAGKGHEKYQEIKGVKYHFDDNEVLVENFELLRR
ncbi:MAG: UDP-N-acetylmuramoyl-L-alanyl-D-glutamate--2,6-diaminopimelate ligase [Chitinophagaceae bacterium]